MQVNPNSYLNKITLKELDRYFEWIDRKTPEWTIEGKQLIKDWQKQQAKQKNKIEQEKKQIKLEL